LPELDYIPLFLDFYERYAELSYEERGRLVWAMLAYARDEDPAPHLTEDLRRLAFGNEKGIIDRTGRTFAERRERRKAVAKAAAEARWNAQSNNAMQTHANASKACHNNNNNYNNNNNDNNNKGGGRTYGGPGKRSADAHTVGQETIL